MAKHKTLYYLPTYGQLGNQLATLAHLLAFAIEYNYVVVYPQSASFLKQVEIAQKKDGRLQFNKFFTNSTVASIITKILKLLFLNRNSKAFHYLVINKKFVADTDFDNTNQPDAIIVTNWLFRYYKGIEKHQDALRKQLLFTAASVENAQKKWLSLQDEYQNHTFFGVHVRRGDYATWLDGKYFYNDDTYYTWLTQLSGQVKNAVFIISSNENLHFTNTQNLDIIYANGSASEDLFLLSGCNYIIGPPSTFSSWSAFLGDQYLLLMENKDEVARIDNFRKFYLK